MATSDKPTTAEPGETPGQRVKRLRNELLAAERALHAPEGAGRADVPELFRAARVWHILRTASEPKTTRAVMERAYPNEARIDSAEDAATAVSRRDYARRSAAVALRSLESRGLVRQIQPADAGMASRWVAERVTPDATDAAVLRALDAHAVTAGEVARRAEVTAEAALASLRRLSLLGLANPHSRTGSEVCWRAMVSPFEPSAQLFGVGACSEASAMSPMPVARGTHVAAGVRPARRSRHGCRLDPGSLVRVFAVLPPPQGVPASAEHVAAQVYGAARTADRLHAIHCALRSLCALGLAVGSRTTDKWTRRVRGPSEDDQVVLAALGDDPLAEPEIIAAVWRAATADQAAAVLDALRRLRVFGLAERVPPNKGRPLRWRKGSTPNPAGETST